MSTKNKNEDKMSTKQQQKTLWKALNEIDALDVGQCKRKRIEGHVIFCRKYNIKYNLKKLEVMSRNEIRDLKYSYKKLTKHIHNRTLGENTL